MKALEFIYRLKDMFSNDASKVINSLKSLYNNEERAAKGAAQLEKSLSSIRSPAQLAGSGLNVLKTGLTGLAVGAAAFLGVGGAAALGVKSIVDAAGYKEQNLIAFTSLLGSSSRAMNVYAHAAKFAAITPFDTPGVIDATKQLLAYGFATKDLEGVMTSAGNVAAGMGKPLAQAVDAFGALKSGNFGQAFGAGGGFTLLGIARKQLEGVGLKFDRAGSYKGTVEDAMTAVQKIIKERFGKGMEMQSQSVFGLASTLQSRPFELFSSINDSGALEPIRKTMSNLSDLTDFSKAPGSLIQKRFQDSIGGLLKAVFGPMADMTSGSKGTSLVNGLIGWIDKASSWIKTNGPGLISSVKQIFASIGAAGAWLAANEPSIFAGITQVVRVLLPVIQALLPLTPVILGFSVGVTALGVAFRTYKTIQSALDVIAYMPKVFSKIATGVFDAAGGLNKLFGVVGRVGTAFGTAALESYKFIAGLIRTGIAATVNAARGVVMFTINIVRMGVQMGITAVSSVAAFGANLVRLGVQALLTGGRMAAAWLIGLGPIGWVIIAIAAIGTAFVILYNKVGWFRRGINAAWAFIKHGAASLWTYFESLPARFVQFGANIMNGLKNGILGGLNAVKNTIVGVADSIVSVFTGPKGIDAHSPARRFFQPGAYIPDGIALGIHSGRDKVHGAIKALATGAALTATVGLQVTSANSAQGARAVAATTATRVNTTGSNAHASRVVHLNVTVQGNPSTSAATLEAYGDMTVEKVRAALEQLGLEVGG